jgi:hypothetical protein
MGSQGRFILSAVFVLGLLHVALALDFATLNAAQHNEAFQLERHVREVTQEGGAQIICSCSPVASGNYLLPPKLQRCNVQVCQESEEPPKLVVEASDTGSVVNGLEVHTDIDDFEYDPIFAVPIGEPGPGNTTCFNFINVGFQDAQPDIDEGTRVTFSVAGAATTIDTDCIFDWYPNEIFPFNGGITVAAVRDLDEIFQKCSNDEDTVLCLSVADFQEELNGTEPTQFFDLDLTITDNFNVGTGVDVIAYLAEVDIVNEAIVIRKLRADVFNETQTATFVDQVLSFDTSQADFSSFEGNSTACLGIGLTVVFEVDGQYFVPALEDTWVVRLYGNEVETIEVELDSTSLGATLEGTIKFFDTCGNPMALGGQNEVVGVLNGVRGSCSANQGDAIAENITLSERDLGEYSFAVDDVKLDDRDNYFDLEVTLGDDPIFIPISITADGECVPPDTDGNKVSVEIECLPGDGIKAADVIIKIVIRGNGEGTPRCSARGLGQTTGQAEFDLSESDDGAVSIKITLFRNCRDQAKRFLEQEGSGLNLLFSNIAQVGIGKPSVQPVIDTPAIVSVPGTINHVFTFRDMLSVRSIL